MTEIVHVLLRRESQYVETAGDAYSTSSTNLVGVFARAADAQQYLDDNVREPLHEEYKIEERDVRRLDG